MHFTAFASLSLRSYTLFAAYLLGSGESFIRREMQVILELYRTGPGVGTKMDMRNRHNEKEINRKELQTRHLRLALVESRDAKISCPSEYAIFVLLRGMGCNGELNILNASDDP